ncbi:MAG: ATP-dependent RNA helicase [Bacteroidetes bacterium]|nr:ATP-dependent RNA helicase [Bacteroidota bacterium]
MALEWKQKCKDCGKEFGYSDISLQRDLRKGLSRAERCDDCRKQHASEIKSIASSHFALKPRKSKPSILGYPFLGQIEHGERILKEFYKQADNTGMDVGLKDHHIKQIYEALEQNQVLVIVAPTGTGKSTFLPSKFIDPLPDYPIDYFTKKGPIIVTQPRIPAARDIPKTIGNKLVGSSVGAGYDIGFRHGDKSGKRRGDNYDRKRNRLIFVTDGSLINWLEEGQISDFSMIIVDEAHERSCNIDLILGLAKRELLKYPHLKFIIASATIDAESFVNYFSSSTTVKQFDFSDCQKSFGYEEFPWKLSELRKEDFEETVVEKNKDAAKAELKKFERTIASTLANKIVELINTTDKGGIVGFLHGEEHINRAVKLVTDKLKGRRDVKVFPLYTGVGTENIEAALADINERRVVIATNIAETSLTIRDVVYVVDSGLIKQSDWNPVTCRQELNVKFHSKDGCKQRWGRAGRVQKGFVYKLYTKEQFIKFFPSHTPPEIKRSNAESMILGAMASGVNDIETFSMLEKPEGIELERALNVVKKRGIVDKDFDFTEDGREVYRLSKALSSVLDKVEYNSTQRALDVASFLILADKYTCLVEAATAICMMPRMGNALYWAGDGLLQWDKNLNLISKDYRIRLIDSFKAGCIDDLDFACKLYSLYEGCFFHHKFTEKHASFLTKEFSLNLENFQLLKETRDDLINVFCQGKQNRDIRQLDLSLVSRVRVLASLSWNDRIVSLKKGDALLFESKEYDYQGTISDNCAGDWNKAKKAIIGILDQNENDIFIDGKRTKAPVANFLIKYVEPPASKNVIDVISAFKKYQLDDEIKNSFSNCVADLNIPINRKIEIDDSKKPISIFKSFHSTEQLTNSTTLDDLFIKLQHGTTASENKSVYEMETPKGVKASDNLILEQWMRKSNKVVAVVDNFSNYNSTFFSNIKVNDTVEATIKRPIFNVKGNGLREIIGFVISIHEFHYTLPVESIFIEFNNDLLVEMLGRKITLTNIGITPNSKQPLFSSIPSLEKERLEIFKQSEVIATVVKKSFQKILCQVQDEKLKSTHFVSISSSSINDDRKFLELDGVVTLELIKSSEAETPNIDCHDDSLFDLTYELKDMISDLLHEIKNDRNKYSAFINSGIEINRTVLVAKKKLQFEKIIFLSLTYPLLSEQIRYLHEMSWELNGKIKTIQKKIEQETKSREAKTNLILNINKNESNLLKARDALVRNMQKRTELRTKMSQPGNSSQWLAKANIWLSEFDSKIIDISQQITRYESWVKEGKEKLKNWKD